MPPDKSLSGEGVVCFLNTYPLDSNLSGGWCMHKNNNLSELYQSAYNKYHSTKTALIKVQDDSLRAIENNCCVTTAATRPFSSI